MVKLNAPQLDTTFAALADPTRRALVQALTAGERRVTDLAAPIDMSLPAVSKHLGVLERAGLIERHRVGREQRCRLCPAPLKQANDYLNHYKRFWTGQLDALADFLESPPTKES